MLLAGRFVSDWVLIVDHDGIAGIEPHHAAPLDVHAGHAVAGGGKDERVIEADFQRSRLDFTVPIRSFFAQSEVPFAYRASNISGLLEHKREGIPSRLDDQRRITWQNAGAALPPGIFAGHQRISRGRTGGRWRMRIAEAHALFRQPVDVWRAHACGAVAAHVPVPKVVGVHVDDVRPPRGSPHHQWRGCRPQKTSPCKGGHEIILSPLRLSMLARRSTLHPDSVYSIGGQLCSTRKPSASAGALL